MKQLGSERRDFFPVKKIKCKKNSKEGRKSSTPGKWEKRWQLFCLDILWDVGEEAGAEMLSKSAPQKQC